MATVAQVELAIPEATRALSEALAKDSISIRTIRESDGYLDSGWLDARTLEPTGARQRPSEHRMLSHRWRFAVG